MRRVVLIVALLAAVSAAGYLVYVSQKPRPSVPVRALTVSFLDASMGNAIVVAAPGGTTTVIDPGPERTAHALARHLLKQGVRSLNIVVSGPSPTRAGSLEPISKRLDVRKVYRGELEGKSRAWRIGMKALEDAGAQKIVLTGGDSVKLGDSVTLEVLSPPLGLIDGTDHDYDNNSLVMRLRFGQISVLLPSEVRLPVEAALIESGQDLTSNVLVVGRYGRSNCTSLEFLSRVRPEVCVVPVAAGSYSPSAAVLRRVDTSNTGAALYRTDRDGIIHMITDGHSIVVRTEGVDRG